MPPIFVTGAAGFIGYHVARQLLLRGEEVAGVDDLGDYYDPQLKRDRLNELSSHEGFLFQELDIADAERLETFFSAIGPRRVIHLAAQAGVRYSIDHPKPYVQSNLVGFLNMLELCRHASVEHLLYASSSSVYGANTVTPFSTRHNVDHPLSLYAATKKANELMAHSYSHLFRLPTTGLRFFTVYGPWGRPDMAIYRFTEAIASGRPIELYNEGKMRRDFTYVEDAVECVLRLLDKPPSPDPDWTGDAPRPDSSNAPYRVFNLGGNQPVELERVISLLEKHLGREADRRLLPMQPGDVVETDSETDDLVRTIDYVPETSIDAGIEQFVAWYRDYHRIS